MHIHEERLPGEDVTAVPADAKTVRLTLTSRHILTRTLGPGMSMFGDNPGGEDDLPEGFSPDAIAAFDAPYEDTVPALLSGAEWAAASSSFRRTSRA